MTEATTAKKSTAEKIPVTMEDGSVIEFNKKQKLVKTANIADDGTITVRLNFTNGRIVNFTMPTSLLLKFAAHGAEQKLGDAIAGETDVNDAVLAVEDLVKRLEAGDWTAKREAGAFAGASILIQALVEASGKTVEEIKAYLAPKTQAEKLALRKSAQLKPIIDCLEAEKAKTSKSTVDTDSLLGELGLAPSDAPAKAPKSKA